MPKKESPKTTKPGKSKPSPDYSSHLERIADSLENVQSVLQDIYEVVKKDNEPDAPDTPDEAA